MKVNGMVNRCPSSPDPLGMMGYLSLSLTPATPPRKPDQPFSSPSSTSSASLSSSTPSPSTALHLPTPVSTPHGPTDHRHATTRRDIYDADDSLAATPASTHMSAGIPATPSQSPQNQRPAGFPNGGSIEELLLMQAINTELPMPPSLDSVSSSASRKAGASLKVKTGRVGKSRQPLEVQHRLRTTSAPSTAPARLNSQPMTPHSASASAPATPTMQPFREDSMLTSLYPTPGYAREFDYGYGSYGGYEHGYQGDAALWSAQQVGQDGYFFDSRSGYAVECGYAKRRWEHDSALTIPASDHHAGYPAGAYGAYSHVDGYPHQHHVQLNDEAWPSSTPRATPSAEAYQCMDSEAHGYALGSGTDANVNAWGSDMGPDSPMVAAFALGEDDAEDACDRTLSKIKDGGVKSARKGAARRRERRPSAISEDAEVVVLAEAG
ncbi:hypothetical protein HK101_002261, partial [Irineochytrium annulatum]